MEMELACTGTDEFVGSSNVNDATQILIKGKRTKRQRPLSPSPCAVNVAVAVATNTNHTMITSSSSSASEEGTHVISGGGGGDYGSFSSTTTTYESTEEEEDMANCLILLAQGVAGSPRLHKFNHPHQLQGEAANTYNNKTEQKGSSSSSSRIRFAEMATVSATASSKIGFYIYECKTCNRTFPSFQALGGHRASHKKPKVSSLDEKKPPPSSPPLTLPQPNYDFQEAAQGQPLTHIKTGPHQISLQLPSNRSGFNSNNKAAKIHECSICGSEFTSGQALGGHMRRHRASARTSSDQVAPGMGPIEAASCNTSTAVNVQVKPRNILQLDLNLPAPEDDLRESKFQFTPTQKTLVLSAPALVDCHY